MKRLLLCLLALAVAGGVAGGVALATGGPPTGKLVVDNFCPDEGGVNAVSGEPLDMDAPPPEGTLFTGVCEVRTIGGKPATGTLHFAALITDNDDGGGRGFAIVWATAALPDGDITVQGGGREEHEDSAETLAVTGGTGKYAGARGTVVDEPLEDEEGGTLFRDTFRFIR
jgi:hypothetical protein